MKPLAIAVASILFCGVVAMADDARPATQYNVLTMPDFRAPSVFTIWGANQTVVVIHPDGRVDYTGTPDEAAKAFWDAVQRMGMNLACKSEPKDAP